MEKSIQKKEKEVPKIICNLAEELAILINKIDKTKSKKRKK